MAAAERLLANAPSREAEMRNTVSDEKSGGNLGRPNGITQTGTWLGHQR